MSSFPPYVDGKPPVVSLAEYDDAEWARETAVDSTPEGYVAVNMNDPTHIVARLDNDATKTLDEIFKSAKQQYASQQANQKS
ncbi:CYFA0S13e00870g1_1 [Cyberlindnera fabianii]|uniref:CYFA0S13e00870g1_1 n=1 Tax=Cyberlindnera fabianii TaxID=36022 RepID=A0A061B298_CYBFA|nr:CYFA0S13e00870g1_1 [Cyberlindnera fabianii]